MTNTDFFKASLDFLVSSESFTMSCHSDQNVSQGETEARNATDSYHGLEGPVHAFFVIVGFKAVFFSAIHFTKKKV